MRSCSSTRYSCENKVSKYDEKNEKYYEVTKEGAEIRGSYLSLCLKDDCIEPGQASYS